MVSTFSSNIQLEEPARGDQVGVWDTPVNSNMTVLDLIAGGAVTISLNNSPVVLASGQYQSKFITFNSTLTGSVSITFPTSFRKSYEILNLCTGSSAFVITLQTTAAGGQVICCPPGVIFEVANDGANMRFKNFEKVGTYWDYAGSSVPAWVSGCTIAPYLNCDGSAFSGANYPFLAVILGGTTLPDARGRSRFALDQGAVRISTSVTGFSGSSVGSGGGSQATTLITANLPAYTPSGTIAVTKNFADGFTVPGVNVGVGGTATGGNLITPATITASFNGTAQGGTSTPLTNLPPAYIGGLTLIRSA